MIVKEHYEQLYANKLDNIDEMDKAQKDTNYRTNSRIKENLLKIKRLNQYLKSNKQQQQKTLRESQAKMSSLVISTKHLKKN